MLPWEGRTIVGTTERKVTPEQANSVFGVGSTKEEVEFICDSLKPYLVFFLVFLVFLKLASC